MTERQQSRRYRINDAQLAVAGLELIVSIAMAVVIYQQYLIPSWKNTFGASREIAGPAWFWYLAMLVSFAVIIDCTRRIKMKVDEPIPKDEVKINDAKDRYSRGEIDEEELETELEASLSGGTDDDF